MKYCKTSFMEYYTVYLFTVPAAPPDNVTVTAETSTSIRVTWQQVPAIDQNGIITQYEVMYEPLETFDGQISMRSINITNASVFEVLLEGLEEYVEYNITVRAYTAVGEGPFSTELIVRTLEDGESFQIIRFWLKYRRSLFLSSICPS